MSGSDSVRRRDECSTMYVSNPDYYSNVGNAQQKQYNCYYLVQKYIRNIDFKSQFQQ